jgi:hypothetical protein
MKTEPLLSCYHLSLCIEKALSGSFSLVESPWLDLSFEELIDLGSGATMTTLLNGENSEYLKKKKLTLQSRGLETTSQL